MAQTYATEVKLFNKWSFDDIQVDDISLEVLFWRPCFLFGENNYVQRQ
jgi:hypothetical protein